MTKCSLKDREHKIWQFQKIEELKFAKNHEILRKCSLCFFYYASRHRTGQFKNNQTSGKKECRQRRSRFLHSHQKKTNKQKETNSESDPANNADAILAANLCNESLQTNPITLSTRNTSIETKAFYDTGSTLFFMDKNVGDKLNVQGKSFMLNIAGIRETKKNIHRQSEN